MTLIPPRRILSQKAMREARERIDFCYICGQKLPPRGRKGSRSQVVGEHVIPRALLEPEPDNQAERWAVVLDVHCECEAAEKQHVDHLLKLLHEIHSKPRKGWAASGHIRRMPLQPSLRLDARTGLALTAFSGLAPVINGIWRWIRGIHATLYAQFLSADTGHLVIPPVPGFTTQTNGPTIEQVEEQSWLTHSVLKLAYCHDKWDGVSAWGGRLEFRCVWWHRNASKGKPDWVCFWCLVFPGVFEWSRQVLAAGFQRPWHGYYVCAHRPEASSFLASADFPEEPNACSGGLGT